MDFKEALAHSPQPSLTLVQAYVKTTGEAVGQRKIQKLLKTYSEEEVMDSILIMENRKVERPFPYMCGILKNIRANRLAISGRNGRDAVASAVEMLAGESEREDRPKLRSPFDVVTKQP
jgi:hypothetical protein